MISVNGQLDEFSFIKEKTTELTTKSIMSYIEVVPWFINEQNYGSLEGHVWGKKAHYISGKRMAEIISGFESSNIKQY